MASTLSLSEAFRCCRPRHSCFASHSRTFSSTPARRKSSNLPNFKPTSSPDLDALLQSFRTNVFLPAGLSRLQRNMIYRRRYWSLLQDPDEPATARIGNEVVQLHPVDRTKDEPRTSSSIQKCLELMRESGDWQNLDGFLIGLKNSKRTLNPNAMTKIIRMMIDEKRHAQLLHLLYQVEDTSIGLWHTEAAREAMWGAWRQGAGAWNMATVLNGTNYAETIWSLLHDPKHTEGINSQDRPNARPEIIGVLMQMHAAKAILTGADTGADPETLSQVEKYTKLMFRQWGKLNVEIDEGDWATMNNRLCIWAVLLQGIQLARRALGSQSAVSNSLAAKEDQLAQLVDRAVAIVGKHVPEGRSRRGLLFKEELAKFPV